MEPTIKCSLSKYGISGFIKDSTIALRFVIKKTTITPAAIFKTLFLSVLAFDDFIFSKADSKLFALFFKIIYRLGLCHIGKAKGITKEYMGVISTLISLILIKNKELPRPAKVV